MTARRQYLAVYGRGHRVGSKSFTLFGLPNSLGYCRLGVTVTRKFGNAVRRNRGKRLMREVFRLNRSDLADGIDVVVNARRELLDASLDELKKEFVDGYRRLRRRTTMGPNEQR